MRNLEYPLNWGAIFNYVGFPAFLKPHDGGGWKSVYKVDSPQEFFAAYDESGDLCMTLQGAVQFQEYFRCYVIDRRKVHVMRYDPGQPHHLRYVPGNPPPSSSLGERMVNDALTLCRALGYDLNTVEFAVQDGIPYAIDFMNPAPDAALESVGPENFRWVVDAVAQMAVERALAPAGSAALPLGAVAGAAAGEGDGIMSIRHATQSEHRDRRGVSDGRPGDARPEFAHPCRDRAEGQELLAERVKPEMHQSVVEIGTGVCKNIQEAKEEIRDIRRQIVGLARENGLRLAAGGTHPFAEWREQEIYPDDRYKVIVEDLKMVARANLIFGLHVHIGVEDRETAIQLMNSARYFLPHLLALSANSPFWLGMDTGLSSYRCKVFDKFPRTNIPDLYQSWSEFDDYVKLLIQTNCIDNAKKIWWDIRPHPHFPTLEFRVCDMPMRLEESIAIAALCQAIIAKLYRLHEQNLSFPALQPLADHGK